MRIGRRKTRNHHQQSINITKPLATDHPPLSDREKRLFSILTLLLLLLLLHRLKGVICPESRLLCG